MSAPPRHLGPLCEQRLERGSVAYPCRLRKGHQQVPPLDPEPCFADEVPGSITDWRAWRARQDAAQPDTITSAAAHSCGGTFRLSEDSTEVYCTGCPETRRVASVVRDDGGLADAFTAAGEASRLAMDQRSQRGQRHPLPAVDDPTDLRPGITEATVSSMCEVFAEMIGGQENPSIREIMGELGKVAVHDYKRRLPWAQRSGPGGPR